jgi:hypothetical protein
MLSRSITAYYDPIRQSRRHAATSFYLIRSAFAVRERLGDPRDLPYFCGCAFPACRRPYPGGPPCHPVMLTRRFQTSSTYHGVATHDTVSASNIRRVVLFRGCIVRFMLRPARLPCPPDWLRRDEVTCSSSRLLRYIVTPAFDAARYRTALGVRLDGRTGNLPSSGLSPDKSQQLVRLHDKRNKHFSESSGRIAAPKSDKKLYVNCAPGPEGAKSPQKKTHRIEILQN